MEPLPGITAMAAVFERATGARLEGAQRFVQSLPKLFPEALLGVDLGWQPRNGTLVTVMRFAEKRFDATTRRMLELWCARSGVQPTALGELSPAQRTAFLQGIEACDPKLKGISPDRLTSDSARIFKLAGGAPASATPAGAFPAGEAAAGAARGGAAPSPIADLFADLPDCEFTPPAPLELGEPAPPARPLAQDSAVAAAPERPSRRALLVDDDALVRQMLQDALQRLGFEVLTADDGAKGLSLLSEELLALDLLVTDVRMPNMDGEAFIHTIRSAGGESELAIVAMTGSLDGAVEKRLERQGADAVLDKAIGPQLIAQAAGAVVERKRRASGG